MVVSFLRSGTVILIRLLIFLLWVIDEITNFDIRKVLKVFGIALLSVVMVGTFGGLYFSIKTQYISNVVSQLLVPDAYETKVKSVDIGYPKLVKKELPPEISAKAVVIGDGTKILYEKDSEKRLAPASTAKLVTALVTLDLYKLDDVLEVSKECTEIDSTKASLPAGEKFTVKDLLYTMLIGSAGDAACVLATSKVSYDDFIKRMNAKVLRMGMINTNLSNPIGLDGFNGENYSTASDLYILSVEVMKNPIIKDIVGSKKYNLISQDKKFNTLVYTTNLLLWEISESVGIKTGTTEGAGEVLAFDYVDKEKDLKIIVMGSQDRFADTKKLLGWVLGAYSWRK